MAHNRRRINYSSVIAAYLHDVQFRHVYRSSASGDITNKMSRGWSLLAVFLCQMLGAEVSSYSRHVLHALVCVHGYIVIRRST